MQITILISFDVLSIIFQTFFVRPLLLIVYTWNSSPFEVISSDCNALVVPFWQFLEGSMEVLCERVNDPRHSLLHLLNCLITTASKVSLSLRTISRVRNCHDAHLGQIVCDKDGVSLGRTSRKFLTYCLYKHMTWNSLFGQSALVFYPLYSFRTSLISLRFPAVLESIIPLKN